MSKFCMSKFLNQIISHKGIFSKIILTQVYKGKFMAVHSAIFVKEKAWKQLKYPSVSVLANKSWYIM